MKDDEVALLNLVKALKEIDTMDLSHIEKLIQLSQSIKQENSVSDLRDRRAGTYCNRGPRHPLKDPENHPLIRG